MYDALIASTIDAQDYTIHGVHLGPMKMSTVTVTPGANVYPVPLVANAAGRIVATAETFANAAWKSLGTVVVPATANQRAILTNVTKSELQGLSGNAFAFTADLQPFGNVNTNSTTADASPFSVQLAVANCASVCNVFVTLV